MLRHSTSIGGQPRHNTFDVEMHGVVIPPARSSTWSMCRRTTTTASSPNPSGSTSSAADLYSDKILRSGHDKDGRVSHMAFGVGPHLCPGAWISEQETVIGAQVLSEVFRNVRIETERMPKDLDG